MDKLLLNISEALFLWGQAMEPSAVTRIEFGILMMPNELSEDGRFSWKVRVTMSGDKALSEGMQREEAFSKTWEAQGESEAIANKRLHEVVSSALSSFLYTSGEAVRTAEQAKLALTGGGVDMTQLWPTGLSDAPRPPITFPVLTPPS